MNKLLSWKFLVIFIFLALSACTNLQQEQTQKTLESNFSNDTWSAKGRISLIREQDNWYAKFNWEQEHNDFQINFTGPLGETELQISQVNKEVTLQTPSIKRHGDYLEQLVYQETGWNFPVTSLKYWLKGQPDPSMAVKTKIKGQQISDIFQADWHIQYPKRVAVKQADGSFISLPKKIIAIGKNIKIKLIITQWSLDSVSTISTVMLMESYPYG